MKFSHIVFFVALIAAMASCSTPKDITYFQDFEPGETMSIENVLEIKFKPDDKISIHVSTENQDVSALFSLNGGRSSQGAGSTTQTVQNNRTEGSNYTIDQEGFIRFPLLGRIHVAGLNRQELQDYIRAQIIEKQLAREPIVTVDYENLYVTILGDAKAGRVKIDRDKFTLLDAIASSGDLSITGLRQNVKVIRDNYGKKCVYEVNLCSAQDLYNSPAYYLQQNDVVYVEMNDKQKRNATTLGNQTVTPAFWMSMASFLVTIVNWFK